MHSTRNLNFLPRTSRLHFLQAGTLVALVACGVMTGFALRGNGQYTATIADITTPTPKGVAAPQQAVAPKAISENPAMSAIIGEVGDSVRYSERQTGRVFSVDLRTRRTEIISAQQIPNSSYDISALSPDGRSLAFTESKEGETTMLSVGASDGSSSKKILETRAQDIRLQWPSTNMLSLDSKRDDKPGRDLATVDLNGNLQVRMMNRENLELAWSPDGTQLLFSYFSAERGVSLWRLDVATDTAVSLDIATSARKCAWHTDGYTITCGVPAKSALTRDVSVDRSATVDDIVTINLLTLQQDTIYHASDNLVGIVDPIISSSGIYVVFTNVFDQRLYLFPL